MADTGKMFSVLHIVLDSGERLPCLVDATTWIPARVALRWAMRYRRYRVQSSTLAANLRVLGKVCTGGHKRQRASTSMIA